MLFNSFEFLVFFPIVLLIYYVIPAKYSYLWLLAASYYFYMCWNPQYAVLILASTAITYLSGILISKLLDRHVSAAKWCVAGSFILNLGILVFFKYSPFIIDNINQLMLLFGKNPAIRHFDILLPVGISFYTFQALSYTIDVYRRDTDCERNFARYALFVSFFPQLVAGPIERSKDLLGQLKERYPLNHDNIVSGLFYMAWGFFLKLVISDRAAILVNHVYASAVDYNGLALLIATTAFAFQIYTDFNGYSCIAIGSARIIGIRLTNNFHTPYLSASISEFWRRWHISLSSWFRDYLYIPLGGSRKGTMRKHLNTMCVFFVSGLWHGASWHFVIWGMLNGLYSIIGEILQPIRSRFWHLFNISKAHPFRKALAICTTFVLVLSTWIFFRAENLSHGLLVLGKIANLSGWSVKDIGDLGLPVPDTAALLAALFILAVGSIMSYKGTNIEKRILTMNPWLRAGVSFILLWIILIFGIYGISHDAASFLYFQF